MTNDEVQNVLVISGGTGVTYALPIIKSALADSSPVRNVELVWTVRHLENLAWVGPELAYLKSQLDQALTRIIYSHDEHKLEKAPIVSVEMKKRFRIRLFVTRPDSGMLASQRKPRDLDHNKGKDYGFDDKLSPVSSRSSTHSWSLDYELKDLIREHPNFSITYLDNTRPGVPSLVNAFIDETVEKGRTQVIGSGPPELGTQIRAAVAAKNLPSRVWCGDDKGDVECVWDDRMG